MDFGGPLINAEGALYFLAFSQGKDWRKDVRDSGCTCRQLWVVAMRSLAIGDEMGHEDRWSVIGEPCPPRGVGQLLRQS